MSWASKFYFFWFLVRQLKTSVWVIDREIWIQGPAIPEDFYRFDDLKCVQSLNSTFAIFYRKSGISYLDFSSGTWTHKSQPIFWLKFFSCTLIQDKIGDRLIYSLGDDSGTEIDFHTLTTFNVELEDTTSVKIVVYSAYYIGLLTALRQNLIYIKGYNIISDTNEPIYKVSLNQTVTLISMENFLFQNEFENNSKAFHNLPMKAVPYYRRFTIKTEKSLK